MKNNPPLGSFVLGYGDWMAEPTRATSGQTNLGAYWKSEEAFWRVAWIDDTGDLYAVQLERRADRFVWLGQFEKKDLSELTRHWFDGDNLTLFIQRCTARAAVPKASGD